MPVSVTNTVIGYLRRRLDGEVIDFVELDMPTRTLDTIAVMCTITPEALQHNGIEPLRVPGALHAAEHAAIGLLPLVASCDRGDIGGVSTAVGPGGRIADDIRLRRLPRRCRIRRPRIPADRHVVGRDGRGDRGLRMPARLPVVRAVAEMRQRQRSARQGGRGAGAAPGARRARGSRVVNRPVEATDPSTVAPTDRGRGAEIGHAEHTDGCERTAGQRDPFPIPEVRAQTKNTSSQGSSQLQECVTEGAAEACLAAQIYGFRSLILAARACEPTGKMPP